MAEMVLADPAATDVTGASPTISAETLRGRFDPSRERLWAKIASVEQTLRLAKPDGDLKRELQERSLDNITKARACIEGRRAHPNLAWRFLHRVDEDLLLLLPLSEFRARAIEVRTAFELNITEAALRNEWLGPAGGDKGRLVKALDALEAANPAGDEYLREVVRTALRIVNEQVDRRFWVLSSNVLTSVCSGGLLALTAGLLGTAWYSHLAAFSGLGSLGAAPATDLLPVALLGAMGAFVSNVLTKEDFLFVRGGPYWRYLLHPLASKPTLSAFAAMFVYAVLKSELLFAIGTPSGGDSNASPLIRINVSASAEPFAYAVLAVASGFAADKILREMIDAVLKRLERSAEKTTASK